MADVLQLQAVVGANDDQYQRVMANATAAARKFAQDASAANLAAMRSAQAVSGAYGDLMQTATRMGPSAADAMEQVNRSSLGLLGTVGKLRGVVSEVSTTMLAFGAAGAAGLALSAKAAMGFQQQMELLHTQAGAAQAQVDSLSKSVLAMSSSVATGPEELAKSLYHIVSVGVPAAQQMEVLRVAALGAKVGMADTEQTTNALASTMVSGIKGITGASQAMGVLNAVVGAGNMRMNDLNGALSTGLLAKARNFDLSITDVGAALATLTDAGMQATPAATRLGMSFTLLGAPSKAAAEWLGKIGLTTTALAKDMKKPDGLLDALTDLKIHLAESGLSNVDQEQVVSRAFGGGRSAGAIETLLQNLGRLANKYQQINATAGNSAGGLAATEKLAQFNTERFTASLQALEIEAGDHLLPQITDVVNVLRRWTDAFNGLSGPQQNAIVTAAEWTTAILLAGGAIGKTLVFLADAKAAIVALTGAEVAAGAASTGVVTAEAALGTSLVAVGGEAGIAAAAFDSFAISAGGLSGALATLKLTLAGITIPAWLGVGAVAAGAAGVGYMGLQIAHQMNVESGAKEQMAGMSDTPLLISHVGQMERQLHGMKPGSAQYIRESHNLDMVRALILRQEGKTPGELIAPRLTGPGKVPRGPGADAIVRAARKYGLDERAMAAVAMYESGLDPGNIGDHGTSFGLFQLHKGGALGSMSPTAAFNPNTNALVAAQAFAAMGGQGLTGRAAIERFVRQFERPKNPAAEIAGAEQYYYHGFGKLTGPAAGLPVMTPSPYVPGGGSDSDKKKAQENEHRYLKAINEALRKRHEQLMQDLENGGRASEALRQQVLETEQAQAQGNPLAEYAAARHQIMVNQPNGPYSAGYYALRSARLGALNRQTKGNLLGSWQQALQARLSASGALDVMTPGGSPAGEAAYLAAIPPPAMPITPATVAANPVGGMEQYIGASVKANNAAYNSHLDYQRHLQAQYSQGPVYDFIFGKLQQQAQDNAASTGDSDQLPFQMARIQEQARQLTQVYQGKSISDLMKWGEQPDKAHQFTVLMTNTAQSMEQVFEHSFQGLFDHGAKGFFQNFLQGFSEMLEQMAEKWLAAEALMGLGGLIGGKAGGIFSNMGGDILNGMGLPGRAMGGPIDAGQAYMVGERGPEMIVPRSPGTVIPHRAMAGGGTVQHVSNSFNISAPDASTFRRSRGQIASEFARTMRRQAMRNQ